jgi:hypothetical protein
VKTQRASNSNLRDLEELLQRVPSLDFLLQGTRRRKTRMEEAPRMSQVTKRKTKKLRRWPSKEMISKI